MSTFAELAKADSSGGTEGNFLIRWRGKQEGPYPASLIETKLASHEIGLLHEIMVQGRWVSIRDYISERESTIRAELEAQTALRHQQEEEAARKAREREEQLRAQQLYEEKRRNDLLEATLETQSKTSAPFTVQAIPTKSHRGGMILMLALIGLFVCGPFCLAAWVMGSGDLREMDEGRMDASGRSTTSSGRNIGILGTILWLIGVAVLFLAHF